MSGRIAPKPLADFIGTFAFVSIGAGVLFLSAVLGAQMRLGAPALAHNLALGGLSLTITPAAGFMIEALLAFFLVTIVLSAAVAGRAGNLAPLAIGTTLTLNVTIGRALTCAASNPARALGPMVAVGNYRDAWLYLLPTIVGAVAAAIVHMGLPPIAQEQTVMSKTGRVARTPAE
jgi:glycerol uptake facilitator-like aquaporin